MGASLRIANMGGLYPRVDARLLQASQAVIATNVVLTSGAIRPYNGLKKVNATLVTSNVKSIFRMDGSVGERWLSWGVDVDVIRGPVPGDTTQRIYFTGDGEPRMSNYALAASGVGPFPASFHVLGVFRPAASPSASPSGGSGVAVTRFYRRTFVTPFGEEGGASPVGASATGFPNATWALSGLGAPPGNTFAVTGASWAAGVATVAVASTYGLRVGEEVTVTSVLPAGYNGTKVKLTAVAAGSVSYAVPVNPGTYSSGGSIARVASHNLAGGTQRIYRTVVSSGVTKYRFVTELPIADTTYNDTILDAALGEEMRSEMWDMPPTNMRGMVALPNGVVAGFAGNELILSESNQPHAYNPSNRKIANENIVGLGFVGNVLVVGTEGNPYRAVGTFPESVDWIRDQSPYPCLSKRSMASLPYGVIYASSLGLVFCDGQNFVVTTLPFYTEREWRPLQPETMIAAVFSNRYYCWHATELNTGRMIILDRNEPAALVNATLNPAEIYSDPDTGSMYLVIDNQIFEWEGEQGERLVYDWMSKEYLLPKPVNLGWAKVDADFILTEAETAAVEAAIAAIVAANAVLIAAVTANGSLNDQAFNVLAFNESLLETPPPLVYESLTLSLYANGELKATRVIRNSRAVRLPSGYKEDTFSLRVSGNVIVRGIVAGETYADVASV